MAKLVQNNGMYPSGMDALCHIYKGDALYDAVCQGDFFPIYDPLWYESNSSIRLFFLYQRIKPAVAIQSVTPTIGPVEVPAV